MKVALARGVVWASALALARAALAWGLARAALAWAVAVGLAVAVARLVLARFVAWAVVVGRPSRQGCNCTSLCLLG